jgi:release factor glutamine methyltransferase
MATLTVAEALSEVVRRLAAARVPSPEVDARYLVGHAVGMKPLELVLHASRRLSPAEQSELTSLVAEREARRPLQHLLGDVEFYGRRFRVAPGVLVPRPETESLVEVALGALGRAAGGAAGRSAGRAAGRLPVRAADIGTGAGVIGLTLALENPLLAVWCIDRAWAALELTAENAAALGITDRVHLVAADLLGALARDSLDLLVSNPPYIAQGAIAGLDPEVREHDPHLALDGGPDGLDIIGRLLDGARRVLRRGGHLLLEIGDDQGAAARRLALEYGWESVEIRPDLAARDRILQARRG